MQIILAAIRGIVLIEGVCMVIRGALSRFSFFINVIRSLCSFVTATWHITFLLLLLLLVVLLKRSRFSSRKMKAC